MRLDVIVPTYNRSGLLRAALRSLLRAPVPPTLQVTIFAVDNNSADNTAEVVRELQADAILPLRYLREAEQGLSHARNAGISAGSGDLVGFIDDDEQVDQRWYEVVAREFADHTTEFIGGPYLPAWAAPAPSWLPPGYHAAIGVIPPKPRAAFGKDFGGNLMGGNAVIRRAVFDRVGTYSTRLGRSGKGLLSEEDADFYRRVQAAGIHGMYVPDLLIHHHIPAERLTRRYHRRWAYWRAVSQGVLDREQREPVAYLFGIPRHRIGRALRGLLAMPRHALAKGGQGQVFADELAAWDLAGFAYGKHLVQIDKLYSK